MKAMTLLAINGGIGPGDLAAFTVDMFSDLTQPWLDCPRRKTGIPRRVPLWPETVEAVKLAIDKRCQPKNPAEATILFIGGRGRSYQTDHGGYRVAAEFARVMKAAGVKGRSFYDLRRTFQTVAEDSHDLEAVKALMGHAPPENDMSARYRQKIEDARLLAVTGIVRAWLYAPKLVKTRAKGKATDRKPSLRLSVVG